jgi:hypothetical protein
LLSAGAVLDSPLDNAGSVEIIALVNGVATSLALTVSGGSQSGIAQSSDLCVAIGDIISFQVVYMNTDPSNAVSLGAILDANGVCLK